MPALTSLKSNGKRKICNVSESSLVSKKTKFKTETNLSINHKELEVSAASQIQQFWRRYYAKALSILAQRMVEKGITTIHIKTIRLKQKKIYQQLFEQQ